MNVQYPDILDLTKYTGMKDQEFKYEYVGSIGKANKRYFTHIRDSKENNYKEYIFDDVIIKEESIQKPIRIKMAVYKIQPLSKNRNLSKNV